MDLSRVLLILIVITLTNVDVHPALPSAPGLTVDLINASKERTFIALGAPAPDPVWGKAYGRAWGGKGFIGVPHLRAAFLAGEGYHSGIRTVNGRIYGLDDYWYYDINGHRWVNIFPGTDVTNFKQNVIDGKIKVDSLGRGLDSTGMPLPCHLLIHAWGFLTYDSDAKKIMFYGTSGGFSRYFMPGMGSGQPTSAFQSMDGGLSLLEAQGLNKSGPIWGPWAYNTVTGKFEHELASNGRTLGGDAFGQFMYIPSKKKLLYAERQAVWYDPAAKLWSSVVPTQSGLEGIEFSGCLDTKRNRMYFGTNTSNFSYFDVSSNAFVRVEAPEGYKAYFSHNDGSITYDSLTDRILIWDVVNSVKRLCVYDPGSNSWEPPISFPSDFISDLKGTTGIFYDAELGVHFVFTADDSRDNGTIWVYNFKSRSIVEKEQTLTSIKLLSSSSQIEKYLSVNLRIAQNYSSASADTTQYFINANLYNLTPAKITLTSDGIVKAIDTGAAKIAIEKNGLKDTLNLMVVQGSVLPDSITLSARSITTQVGFSLKLSATGHYKSGSLNIVMDSLVQWSSDSLSVITVDTYGKVTALSVGGPVNVTANYFGVSAAAQFTVVKRIDTLVKRIDMRCDTVTYRKGWLSESDILYSAARGRGWVDCSQMLNTRCNRTGGDLLGTFVMVSTPYFQNMERCHYKVDVPDGVYIVRTAIGDATYPNEPIWVRVGTDTIARHYGQGNLNNGYSVWDDTVYVSGGTGLRFNVGDSRGLNDRVGKISYIIILSGEGVSMDDIADDQAVRAELDFSNGDCRTAETAFKVSPNPFNPSVKISINPSLEKNIDVRVYDLSGREVTNLTSHVSGNRAVWDANGYSSGIYTVVLKSNAKKFTKKILLSK